MASTDFEPGAERRFGGGAPPVELDEALGAGDERTSRGGQKTANLGGGSRAVSSVAVGLTQQVLVLLGGARSGCGGRGGHYQISFQGD